jgi:threonine dehydratase
LSVYICRFEFPETPGALRKFLDCLKDDWNVTLFHYRSHGADKGKVLAGLVVPEDQEEDFQEFLTSLNYPYQDETENPVFKSHLW